MKINDNIEVYNGDCLNILNNIDNIDLVVTSPPYFNAREYSQYNDFSDYMIQMGNIFKKVYEKLNNHKYCVVNVGDVICLSQKSKWSSKKYALSAYFIVMMEQIGFHYIDDFIWDKGEVESKRHLGNPPYPFYQYPLNCYEHILIFAKHELDKTKIPCPICHEIMVVSNSQSSIGVQSWECKNPNCPEKSISGRGKRFSQRSIMMENYKKEENFIPKYFVNIFRRDIVKINPVIKINCKGENIKNHSAPYPELIPEMAIRYFSGVGDTVVDIFHGSGTTGIVAYNLNRKYIGIEKDKNYFLNSINRIKEEINENI